MKQKFIQITTKLYLWIHQQDTSSCLVQQQHQMKLLNGKMAIHTH